MLVATVGAQRLVWWLAGGYLRRREEHFAGAVMGVLLDPQGLLALRRASRWRRVRLGPRPFDTPILEHMLLLQAVELRGADRATMTEVFESTGLVDRASRQIHRLRWWQRLAAAQKLGVMRSPRAVPALLRATADREPSVRFAALRALAEIGDESTYPLLLRALEDRVTSVRMADIVLAIGPAIGPDLLERFATLGDPRVKAVYVRLLGMLREPATLDGLLPLVQGTDVQLRLAALEALGAIGDARAVDALHAALGDPDRQIRVAAAQALGQIGARDSMPALQALLADPVRPVRYAAARALAKLGADGRAALEQVAQSGTPTPQGIAEQVLAEQALGLI